MFKVILSNGYDNVQTENRLMEHTLATQFTKFYPLFQGLQGLDQRPLVGICPFSDMALSSGHCAGGPTDLGAQRHLPGDESGLGVSQLSTTQNFTDSIDGMGDRHCTGIQVQFEGGRDSN